MSMISTRHPPLHFKKMSTVDVVCGTCGSTVKKIRAEYNRSIRLGRKFYCNSKCQPVSDALLANRGKKNDNLLRGNDTSDEFSPFREVFRSIRRRGINYKAFSDYDVDLPYLKSLWEEQGGKCAITGIQMVQRYKKDRGPSTPYQASLDRIDSNKGYVKGNVHWVCLAINLMKNSFSIEQVQTFLADIKHTPTTL